MKVILKDRGGQVTHVTGTIYNNDACSRISRLEKVVVQRVPGLIPRREVVSAIYRKRG